MSRLALGSLPSANAGFPARLAALLLIKGIAEGAMASDSDTSDRLFPAGDTLGDLLFGNPVPLSESRSVIARYYRGQSLDIFVRWGLDADDVDANKSAKQLARRCGSDDGHRRLILNVVDQVARAERAKLISKDAAVMKRSRDLASSGVRAARLARDIDKLMEGRRFAMTWRAWKDSRDQPELSKLVVRLIDFVSVTLHESSLRDQFLAIQLARIMLSDLKNELGILPASLIARLACLADGRAVRTALSESTIRRYGLKKVAGKWEPQELTRTPAGRVWQKHWPLVVQVLKLVPPETR